MARLLQNHPSKGRNLTRRGRKDIAADSISSNEINSSSFYPSNSSRERTEYIPALNISGTSTLLDTAELETDRTSIRSSNLPGGCCSTVTIISTYERMLYAVRCLKSNEDMILALAGQFKDHIFNCLMNLKSSPLCDFIAQLVRALHRHRRGHGFESR